MSEFLMNFSSINNGLNHLLITNYIPDMTGSGRVLKFELFRNQLLSGGGDSKQFSASVAKILGQIFCSRGRPVEQFYWTSSRFQGTSNRNSTGRPVEIFIAFLDEISNSKTFEANLQNSSGRPVESYWTSSRIQRTSNRSSTGRPLEQKIWAIMSRRTNVGISK